jgi:glutamyl-tRNA synthetase
MLVDKKMTRDQAVQVLKESLEKLKSLTVFDVETLEANIRPMAEQLGLKTGLFFGTLRVAITGRTAAPPLFQTMAVLGKERCLRRIEKAIEKITKSQDTVTKK